MSDIIALWRGEHAKFHRLLDSLEQEAATIAGGAQETRVDRMLDIVAYLHDYGQQVHHRREDVGFERLLELAPDMAEQVGELLDEHTLLGENGAQLSNLLDQIDRGGMVSRESVERIVAAYASAYRRHLALEDRVVIPRIAALFDEADWDRVRSRCDAVISAEVPAAMAQRLRELGRSLSAGPMP